MVRSGDILTFPVSAAELSMCERCAASAEIGGHSNLRSGDARSEWLGEDQVVGQLGTYFGTKAIYGPGLGGWVYRLGRWVADAHPTTGDGGEDIPATNIDFKASLMRASPDPLDYRLAVRPLERHDGWVYVLILVSSEMSRVHLVGWASDSELPTGLNGTGVFSGAFTIPARELHPMMPIKHFNSTKGQ